MFTVLTVAQFFGLMPVIGITAANPRSLYFRWRSFRLLYTVGMILNGILLLWLFFRYLMSLGIQAKNFGEFNWAISKSNHLF